jgi:diphthamide synthase (EF-2-diphthine--ammonia ligase)
MRGAQFAYALCTAAGKDATLALHRARADGLDVRIALNLYDARTERVFRVREIAPKSLAYATKLECPEYARAPFGRDCYAPEAKCS